MNLLVSDARVSELADRIGDKLSPDQPIVAVSSIMFTAPKGHDRANFDAVLATAITSKAARVPHIFMVATTSAYNTAANMLEHTGAIVLPVRQDTEGGLFRPYATAARVIDQLCPNATMVKLEGAKNLFANPANVAAFRRLHGRFDVITGVRGPATYASMPSYLALTESILATVIRDLTGTFDAASGVMAMSHAGRRIFLQSRWPAWEYLITTPSEARAAGLRVGEVAVDFIYNQAVVAEEERSPQQDDKRRAQFQLMLGQAIMTAGGMGSLTVLQRQSVQAARNALAALERRAQSSQH